MADVGLCIQIGSARWVSSSFMFVCVYVCDLCNLCVCVYVCDCIQLSAESSGERLDPLRFHFPGVEEGFTVRSFNFIQVSSDAVLCMMYSVIYIVTLSTVRSSDFTHASSVN